MVPVHDYSQRVVRLLVITNNNELFVFIIVCNISLLPGEKVVDIGKYTLYRFISLFSN